MQLIWLAEVAKARAVVGVPGWPASDHDEPDSKLAREKIATGLYRRAAPKAAEKAEEVTDGNGS